MSALVVLGGALGDQLLRWPALRALAAQGPVRVLAGRATRLLLGQAWPGLDAQRLDDPALLGLWAADAQPEPWLEGVERAVLLSADPGLARGLAARGLAVEERGQPPPEGAHEACWVARGLGLGEDPSALEVPLLRPLAAWAARLQAWTAAAPEVLLLPGSGGLAKCWPRACWAALGQALAAQGLTVAAALGPDELERGWGPLEGVPTWMGPELPELAAAMASARVVVGNDAGTSHLAAAVGAPLLVRFGPTDPRRWRPIGPRVRVTRWAPGPEGVQAAVGAVLDGVRGAERA